MLYINYFDLQLVDVLNRARVVGGFGELPGLLALEFLQL